MGRIVASILWRRLDHEGHDACRLIETPDGWTLSGQANFVEEGGLLCGLAYRVECARDWVTRKADVSGFVGREPLSLSIAHSPDAGWTVDDKARPDLDGLIDVDLGFTPATNLIALRRFALKIGESALAPAAWFAFPDPRVARMEQTYRRLDEACYDYTGIAYHEVLTVSPAGFVTDYPRLWSAVKLA